MGCCYSEFHALCDRQTYIYIYIVEEGLDGHGLLLLRVSRVMRSSDTYIYI